MINIKSNLWVFLELNGVYIKQAFYTGLRRHYDTGNSQRIIKKLPLDQLQKKNLFPVHGRVNVYFKVSRPVLWQFVFVLLFFLLLFELDYLHYTAQKMKISIKDFFSKCDPISRKLRIGDINWRNPWWKTSFLCSVSFFS